MVKWLEEPDPESWQCCLILGVLVQTPLWPEFFRKMPGIIKFIYTFRMQVKNAWSTINGHYLTDIIDDFTYRKGSDGHAWYSWCGFKPHTGLSFSGAWSYQIQNHPIVTITSRDQKKSSYFISQVICHHLHDLGKMFNLCLPAFMLCYYSAYLCSWSVKFHFSYF